MNQKLEKLGFKQFPALSPFIKHNGAPHIRLNQIGDLELAWEIEALHTNANHALHGGMLMTMMDSAMGAVAMYSVTPTKMTPTVSLTVNFARPSRIGDILIARSCVDRVNSSHVFLTCKGYAGDDLVGTASGIFFIPHQEAPGFNMQTLVHNVLGILSSPTR